MTLQPAAVATVTAAAGAVTVTPAGGAGDPGPGAAGPGHESSWGRGSPGHESPRHGRHGQSFCACKDLPVRRRALAPGPGRGGGSGSLRWPEWPRRRRRPPPPPPQWRSGASDYVTRASRADHLSSTSLSHGGQTVTVTRRPRRPVTAGPGPGHHFYWPHWPEQCASPSLTETVTFRLGVSHRRSMAVDS